MKGQFQQSCQMHLFLKLYNEYIKCGWTAKNKCLINHKKHTISKPMLYAVSCWLCEVGIKHQMLKFV